MWCMHCFFDFIFSNSLPNLNIFPKYIWFCLVVFCSHLYLPLRKRTKKVRNTLLYIAIKLFLYMPLYYFVLGQLKTRFPSLLFVMFSLQTFFYHFVFFTFFSKIYFEKYMCVCCYHKLIF